MNATIKERVAIAQWMSDNVLKFDYFQTSASSPLLDEVEFNAHLQYLKDHGNCLTICPQLTPKLYALCLQVQQTLANYAYLYDLCDALWDFLAQIPGVVLPY